LVGGLGTQRCRNKRGENEGKKKRRRRPESGQPPFKDRPRSCVGCLYKPSVRKLIKRRGKRGRGKKKWKEKKAH